MSKAKIGLCLVLLSGLFIPLTMLVLYLSKNDSQLNINCSFLFAFPIAITLAIIGGLLIAKGETQ